MNIEQRIKKLELTKKLSPERTTIIDIQIRALQIALTKKPKNTYIPKKTNMQANVKEALF